MSGFRPEYKTTSDDRRKKRGEVGTMSENSSEAASLASEVAADLNRTTIEGQASDSAQNGQLSTPRQEMSTVTTETAEICKICKEPAGPTVATAICRLCSHCICSNCVDLLSSTFADIEKSDCLFFFCNDCCSEAAKNIRKSSDSQTETQSKHENVTSETDSTPSNDKTSETSNLEQVGQAPSVAQSKPNAAPSMTDRTATDGNATVSQSPNQTGQPASASTNVISVDMVNNIVNALEALQEKVCSIEDRIANSQDSQRNNTRVTAKRSNQKLAKKSFSDAARGRNAPPAIQDRNAPPLIVVHPPETSSDGNVVTTQRNTEGISLEGRELLPVPRPTTAPELLQEREKERRKYNVCIQNLPESNATSADDRKAYDTMEARCMLAAMRLQTIDVKSAVRIGKKSDDRPRPLMITLDSDREQVLRRARFVRRYKDWQTVFIDPDRTPLEQEKFKETRAEFKRRKEAGENIIMRDGKILTSSRRSSYMDLSALVSQAEERANKEKENPAAKKSSVNLINLADSVSDIQAHTSTVEAQSLGTSSSNSETKQDTIPLNTPNDEGQSSDTSSRVSEAKQDTTPLNTEAQQLLAAESPEQ